MKVGRPLLFNNCMDLDAACEVYFEECEENETPLTITGLALALNTTRRTLLDYEERGEFIHTIKKHKSRVENFAELKLYSHHSTGAIFALKNFGWKDKTEREHTGDLVVRTGIRRAPND